MKFVDLAPTSPLILAQLAPAITYRAVDPTSVDPALDAAVTPTEPAATPALEVHLGNAVDTYI
ncbi:MAG: hypothetical protein ACFCVC_05055 [Acidimicrobiia bacterium]